MHAVVRRYSGPGASQLFEELERRHDEVEQVIRGVPGLVSYAAIRTGDGGITVTVCQDKTGTDESVRMAAFTGKNPDDRAAFDVRMVAR